MSNTKRIIVAEFFKDSSGRVRMNRLLAITLETRLTDKGQESYRHYREYDVDYSKSYGYIFHNSEQETVNVQEVRGLYYVSGDVKIKEKPCTWVHQDDKPPWRSPKTRAIRERNKTRRIRMPRHFSDYPGGWQPDWDVLDWLENYAYQDDAVYCPTCRDYMPGHELCEHCWWCNKSGDYSTPGDRCKCKNREECDGHNH